MMLRVKRRALYKTCSSSSSSSQSLKFTGSKIALPICTQAQQECLWIPTSNQHSLAVTSYKKELSALVSAAMPRSQGMFCNMCVCAISGCVYRCCIPINIDLWRGGTARPGEGRRAGGRSYYQDSERDTTTQLDTRAHYFVHGLQL